MAAVTRAVARTRADPLSDPRYRRVVDKLGADSRRLKQHPPPAKKVSEASAAAKGPANEKAAGAKAKQVDKIEQAETPKPKTSSFLALLQAEIEKVMPKTLGDTEKFMKGGASGDIKGSLKGNVASQKAGASGDLKAASSQAPSEAGIPAKPVTPIPGEPTPQAPQIDAAGAMPAPKPDAEVSLQGSKQDLQGQLDKEKLDDKRLSSANDPRFSAVLASKDAVKKQADAGPGKYRGKEGSTLAQAAAKAIDTAKRGVVILLGVKGGSKAKVLSRQEQAKLDEEKERQRFTNAIEGIFTRTKDAVDKRLADLDGKVDKIFDPGVDTALSAMKSYVEDQLFHYKLERYLLQPGGSLLWIKDQFLDLPDEVRKFYEAGRRQFGKAMNALAEQVAALVESELAAAKAEVRKGQQDVAAEVTKLSPNLRVWGQAAQQDMAGRFGELESGIEDKKSQLAESLAQKYKEAFDKADEALKQIQDENKGLVTQAREKIGEVVKALMEFKERLMGILRKGADTIELILKDPMQFLSNLIAAIKAGFQQFVGNIWEHLKRGFMKWLFGALSGAGIEIPADLTLPSILKLVLSVLGITYERMRAKAVKLLGPTAVAVIEKLVSYIQTLIGGGPAALWAQVKGDLADLKAMVIDAIQDWIISTIVKRAVAKIVTMFNPAGAIIQAVMAIISVVQFVIERAAQIMDFVEAVINSIYNIATGAIGGAASWIERALGNMIPLLIGFLASLIGLGGIGQKIREFITKVQTKVDQAIDKVLKKAVGWIKGLFGKGGKSKAPDERTEAQKQADLTKAIAEANPLIEDKELAIDEVAAKLAAIKQKYQLATLEVRKDSESEGEEADYVYGEVNPNSKTKIVRRKLRFVPAVSVQFTCPPELSKFKSEYETQIKGQEAGLNALKLSNWEANVKRYEGEGRSEEGSKKQREFRETERERLINEAIDKDKLTRSQAERKVEKMMKGLAALHDPDQIAGGDPTKIKRLGSRRVNSSIGSQWRTKAPKMVTEVRERVKEIAKKARAKLFLNCKLNLN